MDSVKEINVKNHWYCFFDDMINIKNLDRWTVVQKHFYLPHWLHDGHRP